MKIRIGNDFVFNWAIERGGLPEDLSSVLEKHLHLSVFGKKVELVEGVDYDITGNVIRIEVTPTIANIIGTYKVEFRYILPDIGFIDEDRKCAVDVDAFQIVARTAQADDPSEFTVTSDMAIAFKGDKGDSAYQVWLDAGNTGTEEDYFAYLRQPAIDAGVSISELEGEIQVSEGLRVQAESERDLAERTRIQSESERVQAEIIRQSNEGDRIENEDTRVQYEAERISKENVRQSNEIDRVEAEGIREQAESERQITIQEAITATNLANEKANLANDAAQNANEATLEAQTATQEATTAASLADMARLAIQDDLALKADQIELVQLAGEVGVKMTNLLQNSSFEDGVIEPISKADGSGGASTLSINTINPISGNYDARLEITTPSTSDIRPYLLLNGSQNEWVLNHVFYFSMSVKINSGTPILQGVTNGSARQALYLTLKDGFNSWTVECIGLANFGYVYFDGRTLWDFNFDNLIAYDLTSIFGTGNEPTKEEMDLLISTLGIDYFEGEITIPNQKLMQWYLGLIRKNKNAIIALGGTII